MRLLHRLALYIGRELARNPAARAKAAETVIQAERAFNEEVKPRAQQAWRDAQPGIERAKRRVTDFAHELRDEYRKGRYGTD